MRASRRDMLTLGAAGVLLGMTRTTYADGPTLSNVEEGNIKLVSEFCAAWSTLDAQKIAGFVSDKIIYQMIDNMPLVKGKEGLVKFITPFLSKLNRAQWDILRTHAIGNIVINERIDNFYSESGKNDAHFEVVGLFLIKDGKIAEWKDYKLPVKQEKKT